MAKNDDFIGMAIAGGIALLAAIFGFKFLSGASQPSSSTPRPPSPPTLSNHATGCNKCPFS